MHTRATFSLNQRCAPSPSSSDLQIWENRNGVRSIGAGNTRNGLPRATISAAPLVNVMT
jgi:hypothetical protein